MSDITDLGAIELSRDIHARKLSCREVMQAYLARIDLLNPKANAIVSRLDAATALKEADARDAELAGGRGRHGSRGWMHGLPQAIKDTGHAVGFPTTFGSPLLANALPAEDSLYVARMKAAGAIIIGKTNMPELGLGGHTYNRIFGGTPGAWDASRSGGGSSGGAGVALAQRLLPVADGSDFMGSLRTPAAWNHVFGLRPSQGRVPAWPKPDTLVAQLGTDGPMARSVRDLAALLTTQAGADARVPLSLASEATSFVPDARASATGLRGLRIGWLADLQAHLPVEAGILALGEQALARCAEAGAIVEPATLGFSPDELWQAWIVWRRALSSSSVAPLLALPGGRAQIKPEALWEHEQAQGLAFAEFMRASEVRTRFIAHMARLFERYELLALPVSQVWPFPQEWTWPKEIVGRTMDTYHRWMEVTLYATFAGLPALSMPAGFDAAGRLPMGLQLIGPPRGDALLLRAAAAYEARSGALLARRPPPPP
jgi:amidase